MRVMVYCPLNPAFPGLHHMTLTSLLSLQWPRPFELVFGRNSEAVSKEADITAKYRRAFDMVKAGGYDALLTVEADMLIPQHALLRMAAVDADVVYGLYVSRRGKHDWLACKALSENDWLPYSRLPEQAREDWGAVVETAGVGLGCTLIRRNVIDAVEFRQDDRRLALDIRAAGFTQAHDLGVVCGHVELFPDPVVYWPDPDQPTMYRTERLR
jgi:hypothetical protein